MHVDKIKMWFVTCSDVNSGMGRAIGMKNRIKAMSKYFDICLLSPERVEDEELRDILVENRPHGVRLYAPHLKKPWAALNLFKLYKKINQMIDYDGLFFTDTFYILFFNIFSRKKMPIIFECHGINSEEVVSKGLMNRGFVFKLFQLIEKKAFSRADRIIVVSGKVSDYLTRRFKIDKRRIHVVHNGVDLDTFKLDTDGSEIKHRYGLDNNHVLLYVGGFKPWHGVYNLIYSFEHIKKEIKNVKLLLVGSDGTEKEIKALVKKKGLQDGVIFTGKVPYGELPIFISAADICVYFPEYLEIDTNPPSKGWMLGPLSSFMDPLKFYEWMAMAKPIVTIDIEDLVERFEREECIVATEPSYEKFADAIINLINHPEKAKLLGKNGRKAVEEKYNWDNTARQIYEICKQAMD